MRKGVSCFRSSNGVWRFWITLPVDWTHGLEGEFMLVLHTHASIIMIWSSTDFLAFESFKSFGRIVVLLFDFVWGWLRGKTSFVSWLNLWILTATYFRFTKGGIQLQNVFFLEFAFEYWSTILWWVSYVRSYCERPSQGSCLHNMIKYLSFFVKNL